MLNVRPTPTALGSSSEPSLYMAELHHRVTNEYARAIASASVTASRASSKEAKAVLETVIQHLVQLAAVHRLLLPPALEESADLGDYLARLCQAKLAAELKRHGTTLHLSVESPVVIEQTRCWRVGLIVSELITNAARHGLPSGNGKIFISVGISGGQVVCRVNDNGTAVAAFRPGLGTRLVNALAIELGGHVERRFSGNGATITVTFPAQSHRAGSALLPRRVGPLRSHSSSTLAARPLQKYCDSGACESLQRKTHRIDHARLRRTLDHISGNLDKKITLAQLARVAGVSIFHFARTFTRAMGVSPSRYVSRLRLENAMAEIVAGRLPLAQIAFNARFSSQTSFTRAFRRATGMAPGEYRTHPGWRLALIDHQGFQFTNSAMEERTYVKSPPSISRTGCQHNRSPCDLRPGGCSRSDANNRTDWRA
jgi:two-component sensor histidine kinase/AraC-like DNA-binding protein